MCEQCHLVTVQPEFAERALFMLRISGVVNGVHPEQIEEQCMLFQCTRSAYYLPPSVKGMLLMLVRLGVPVFDWRNN